MAFFQFTRLPINDDGTITLQNYSGSDIAAGLGVILDNGNLADPSTGKHGYGAALPGADGVDILGITIETLPAGGAGRVQVQGVAICTASGTVTAKDVVMVENASGKVKTQTSAKAQVGQALVTAATGTSVPVLLQFAHNA